MRDPQAPTTGAAEISVGIQIYLSALTLWKNAKRQENPLYAQAAPRKSKVMLAEQAKTMPSIFAEKETRASRGFLEVGKFYAASPEWNESEITQT